MLLEGLETLLVLAKEGTMSKAGSQLYISQSAVSKRIARLEKQLGKKLIEPSGRRIKLTPDAQALIDNVGPGYRELKGLIFDQRNYQDKTVITLVCSETLVAGYLGELMGNYITHDRYISISTRHTPVIVEQVQSGDACIGFCAGHLPAQHGLTARHLFDEPFTVISQQPLAEPPPGLLVNDLKNPANINQASVLQKAGIKPLMEMDSYTAAAQLALGGVASALVPASIVKILKIDPVHCHHFDVLSELTRPVHLCYRQSSYQSERIRRLIEAIAGSVPTAA
ncbi:Transcriptional regulator, LysR family [Photobacterium marinum]|uniref:Transcriptional regulator, LysR family n=1 Tax=Photobacterium marinum TaxID=1056511 RepID=L8JH43_9GAMM|nr:LysR family transcriptional regulator [Photobacterium marinum]ELR67578.1 Transcriptional regulator, LysR family [Photobacterium marinum]